MRCIEIDTPGPESKLRIATRPMPVPKEGEVLVKVAAAGVNRPDLVQRAGSYPPPPGASDIPGLEIAGEIVGTGEKVCALVTGGGYAEYCAVPKGQCLPFPKGLNNVQAAALPETFFTVWHNVFQRARLKEGETLLVHGGGSGIGTVAIQLGKAFGATVFVTAGGAEKCAACLRLGADRAIDYKSEDFAKVIAEATEGRGVDVILDMVGGDYLERNLKSLAFDGRHVSIAFLRGPKAEVNFLPIMLKRLTLTGSTLRPQPVAAKSAIARELCEKVWPLLDSGAVSPHISHILPLEQAEEAHRLMNASDHFGKIVLTL